MGSLGKGRQLNQRTYTKGQYMAQAALNAGGSISQIKTQQNAVSDQVVNNSIDKYRAVAQFYRENIQNLIENHFVARYNNFRRKFAFDHQNTSQSQSQ